MIRNIELPCHEGASLAVRGACGPIANVQPMGGRRGSRVGAAGAATTWGPTGVDERDRFLTRLAAWRQQMTLVQSTHHLAIVVIIDRAKCDICTADDSPLAP